MHTSDRRPPANPHPEEPPLPVRDLHRVPPAEIARRIGALVRQFHLSGSRDVARQVADLLDSLCFHPALGGDGHVRCGYLRLRAQWRWLARTLPGASHV